MQEQSTSTGVLNQQRLPDDHETMQGRYAYARFAAKVAIWSNLFLFLFKLYAGLADHSLAVVYDSFHSLSDVITSVFVLLGLWISERPSDSDHPYGHTKAEAIAGSNVALLLVLSAIWMIYSAGSAIFVERPIPGGLALSATIVSIVIKESLFQWKSRVAKKVGSGAIMADAWHHRSDAFSSVCVLIGLSAIYFLGPDYGFLDPVAGIIVGLILLYMGVDLYRESLSDLMDQQVVGPITDEIRTRARNVEGVHDVEKLMVRKAGMEYSVDIHVEVDAAINVEDAHTIASRVRDTLTSQIVPVRQVLVHIEPHTLGGEDHNHDG